MRFLIIGDIIGKPGRKMLSKKLPQMREELVVDAVIVNGENAAGGMGITPEVCEEILSYGVEVITSGNHIWDKKEISPYIDKQERLLRPLNYPPGVPGKGSIVLETKGIKWAVVNLGGRVFMPPLDCPFRTVKREIETLRQITNIILVDFHAEASSEKIAMGWFLDGWVSCVFGTHTHVATADERILPQGTGYITDIGMTGSRESVIGIEIEQVLNRFLTGLPTKFKVAKNDVILNGIIVEVDNSTGKTIEIGRVSVK